jgi:hypothetical protein
LSLLTVALADLKKKGVFNSTFGLSPVGGSPLIFLGVANFPELRANALLLSCIAELRSAAMA